jgi:hypothetical protein
LEAVDGLVNHPYMSTNQTKSTSITLQDDVLNSPLRHFIHVALFLEGGEGDLSDIRSFIRNRCDASMLPPNWKVHVRDLLKRDPEIERSEEGAWLLRSAAVSTT